MHTRNAPLPLQISGTLACPEEKTCLWLEILAWITAEWDPIGKWGEGCCEDMTEVILLAMQMGWSFRGASERVMDRRKDSLIITSPACEGLHCHHCDSHAWGVCYYPDFSLYFFLMLFSVHSLSAPLKFYVTSCHANGSKLLCWIWSLNLVTHCHRIALWWDFRVQLHQLPLLTPNLVQLFLVIYWSTTEGGG